MFCIHRIASLILIILTLTFDHSSNAKVLFVRDRANLPPNFRFVNESSRAQASRSMGPTAPFEPDTASICPSDTPTTFVVALQQQNLDQLHDLFFNVTTPGHEMYQKYQTPTTLWNLIGPSSAVVSNVGTWLYRTGVPLRDIHFYGDVMEVITSCGIVNSLFNTTMYIYENSETGQQLISQFGHSYIPDRYASAIRMVIGVQTFPVPVATNVQTSDARTSVAAWDEPAAQYRPNERYGQPVHEAATLARSDAGLDGVSAYSESGFDEAAVPTFNEAHHFELQSIPNSAVMIPASIQTLYNLPDRTNWFPTESFRPIVSAGVVEFSSTGRQSYNPVDLRNFGTFSGFSYPFQLNPQYVVGENQRRQPGLEASVDIQALHSTNAQSQTWFWLMSSSSWMYSWAYQFYSQVQSGQPYPQVVSISYTSSDEYYNCGIPGATDCEIYGINPSDMGDSTSYEGRTNTLFQMLGLSGVTVIVSSGDDGANGVYGSSDDNQCTYTQTTLQFIPQWPSTSPYVTSVGATNVKATGFTSPRYSNGQNSKAPLCGRWTEQGPPPFAFHCYIANLHEAAVSIANDGFTSGGGFSTIYSQPAYQRAAVGEWLRTSRYMPAWPRNSTSYLFDRSARGFPDVAMYGGAEWLVLFQSQFRFVAGTSISAPIFAGLVTLLNEVALQYGPRMPLGFINPLLYKMWDDTRGTAAPAFNDITQGDNKRPRGAPRNVFCDGYVAGEGWDPVSGLGSPSFSVMRDYLINLLVTNNTVPHSPSGHSNNSMTGIEGADGPNGQIVGDPLFQGFAGQSFQVHGLPQSIYNIISTPTFQFNAEFAFLDSGVCSAELQARTLCWTHPGNYLASIGMVSKDVTTGNETTFLVRSGPYDEGMLVFINEEVLAPQKDQVKVPITGSTNPVFVRYTDRFTLTIQTPEFIVQLDNSHNFVNQRVAMQPMLIKSVKALQETAKQQHRQLTQVELKTLPHGLLGQTWNDKLYKNRWRYIVGHINDYEVTDGLMGFAFEYNRYMFDPLREAARKLELEQIRRDLILSRGIEFVAIEGQMDVDALHVHDEEAESVEEVIWEDTRNVELAKIVLPKMSGEDADRIGPIDASHIHESLGQTVVLLHDDEDDLPMSPVRNKPRNNKLSAQSVDYETLDEELVWAAVQPEKTKDYEGPLDSLGQPLHRHSKSS